MSLLPQRKSFLPDRPWVQTVWDSSSLSAYLRCPRRYFYQIICGYSPLFKSVDLHFGHLLHKGMEKYHKRKLEISHTSAQYEGVLEILYEAWGGRDEISTPGVGHYWRSHSKNKNLWNVLRAFIFHTEQFGLEPDSRTKAIGEGENTTHLIEFPFQFDLNKEVEGNQLVYCGHLDRVVEGHNGIWVVDYKTTKSTISSQYFDGYQPSTQLPGYAVAAKIIFHEPVLGVMIDAFQVGVDLVRCGRGYILTSEEKANEWLENATYWTSAATQKALNFWTPDGAESISDLAKQASYWPMNTESCFLCPFKAVCASTPSVRSHLLAEAYIQSFWDPLARQENEA